jgi:hypothetical protein
MAPFSSAMRESVARGFLLGGIKRLSLHGRLSRHIAATDATLRQMVSVVAFCLRWDMTSPTRQDEISAVRGSGCAQRREKAGLLPTKLLVSKRGE